MTSAPTKVHELIREATQRQIGARLQQHPNPDRLLVKAQWAICRPPFVTDLGRCYLVVQRHDDAHYSVFVGRQGMCADIYTEAEVRDVAEADVDATVLRLCTARSLVEATNV